MVQTRVGIEDLNFYGGPAFIDVRALFENRGLDLERFNNLVMEKKSVGLPCEDPVTNGVNAAKPIIDKLDDEEKKRIEMVITSSESGIDFGKSISTYIHDYLELSRNCRLFEVKQACYGATAALQMACSYVVAHKDFDPKVLVISTDVAKTTVKVNYAEPSQGTGAVAFLISAKPEILEVDLGATGMYSFEVMDTCRPSIGEEYGDPDLSLFSYLDCLENSFNAYTERVADCSFVNSFDYLAFHSPFAGLVKGAHRKMMRRFSSYDTVQIEHDFQKRVAASLNYGMQVGNLYSASLYMALASLIDSTDFTQSKRIGLFSYGSGCSSEFFSGVVSPQSKRALCGMSLQHKLNQRYELNMGEYELLRNMNFEADFGVKDKEINIAPYSKIYSCFFEGRKLLVLKKIKNYHREYLWS